jgi:hypothetical protein
LDAEDVTGAWFADSGKQPSNILDHGGAFQKTLHYNCITRKLQSLSANGG